LLLNKKVACKGKYFLPSRLKTPGWSSSLKSFIFIILALLSVSLVSAQTPLKVAILPVDIHSPEKLDYMREGLMEMLSTRVDLSGRVSVLEKGVVRKALAQIPGEMDTEGAKKLGQDLGVDFVVFGSLTKLGDSASLDLKVVQVKGDKPVAPVFTQAKRMEEIINRVDDLARMIDEQILGYPLKPAVAEKKEPVEEAGEVAGLPRLPGGFRPLKGGKATAEFWQSQPFPFQIKGMAIGDVDGDGRNEVALIAERTLWIYRWEGEFKLLKKMEGGKLDSYLAVDMADMNKDGKAEIFVTNLQNDRLSSFAVAFRDGEFRVGDSGLDWFLRVVDWGEKGKVLLGQKKGADKGFLWPIYELGWNGKKYKEIRKANLPEGVTVYGFTPLTMEGKNLYLFIDSQFKLKVVDEKGKMLWKSQDSYGTDNLFRAKPMPSGMGYTEGDDLAFVNVRIIPQGKEILILRNISPVGQLFKRTKYYTGGQVQALVWTGAVFMESWKSQEIPGYLSDFQLQNFVSGQGRELVVAVNLPRESMLSTEQRSALMVSRVAETK